MKKLIKLLLIITGALVIAASAVAEAKSNSGIKQNTKIIPQTEKNKTHAVEFYDLMFNQNKPREAVERYVGSEYIQHNPHVADGKEAFIEYFEKMAAEYPKKHTKFIKIIASIFFWQKKMFYIFFSKKVPNFLFSLTKKTLN